MLVLLRAVLPYRATGTLCCNAVLSSDGDWSPECSDRFVAILWPDGINTRIPPSPVVPERRGLLHSVATCTESLRVQSAQLLNEGGHDSPTNAGPAMML